MQQSVGKSNAPAPAKVGWFEERLGLSALYAKYGRKAFPVHSTYFFGEMAAFAFVILVLTGIYLGFMYVPSNAFAMRSTPRSSKRRPMICTPIGKPAAS